MFGALKLMLLAFSIMNVMHDAESAPLSSNLVSSFSSPNPRLPFRLMAVDNTTGDVYIGAEEEIYHLGSDFTLRETVEVGLCNIQRSTVFGEQDKNRLLVIAPAPTERLITCGRCDGYCRLCLNTTDPNLESYTQIQIECTDQTGSNYNVIQAAHIGPAGSQLADSLSINSTDDVMYAVFTKENSSPVQSALCLYKMSDIQQRFTQAVVDCITCSGGTDCDGKSIDYLCGNSCGLAPTEPNPESRHCQANDEEGRAFYAYANGVNPVTATPILVISDVEPTSIITTTEREYTVAFIGSSEGDLLKVHVVDNSSAYQYENVPLGQGSVLRDVFLDEDKEQITMATGSDQPDQGSQVVKLSLANCSNYQTCEECIGESGGNGGDPYCGWCTLEAKCTRYHECPSSDQLTRWLSYNAVQCVSISVVHPSDELLYQKTEQTLYITVEQLPDLRNEFYYLCTFDDSYETTATVDENELRCLSPPAGALPPIPVGDDSIRVTLAIKSTESGIRFVSRDLYFYNCSLDTSCSSCVTTPWPCDWCVYENRCTHNSSSCEGDTIVFGDEIATETGNRGQLYCPQILGPVETETLIPVGVETSYTLRGSNLPTDSSKVKSYECILHVEGGEQITTATSFNHSYVECDKKSYSYSESVLITNVSVSVRWNSTNYIDDISRTTVSLYKCSVNGESCSRCLSEEVTPTKLGCGWCGDDCNVQLSDICQRSSFLNQSQSHRCAPPDIIDFFPVSGPVEGNTRVEIMGTDIGVTFLDIANIIVAGVECNLSGMESFYDPGRSVSCLTSSVDTMTEGVITLSLTRTDGERTSSGDTFAYRNPEMMEFVPKKGPIAGGTRIAIFGTFLDTGRDITVHFGDTTECTGIIFGENGAFCTTGSTQSEGEEHLIMTFDGNKRISTGVFTFAPNPTISNVCGASATRLSCPTPSFPNEQPPVSRKKRSSSALVANLTFDLDGYVIEHDQITYHPDPVYYNISAPHGIIEIAGNGFLDLEGLYLDLASSKDDVNVYIGSDGYCDIQLLEYDRLTCMVPEKQPGAGSISGRLGEGPARDLPAIEIYHGNLVFEVGYVRYKGGVPVGAIAGGVSAAAVLIIVGLVVTGTLMLRKSQKRLDATTDQLELVEKDIQERVQKAFHELQSDMTEVETQVVGLGIPFVNAQDYVRNMLFAGLGTIPSTADPQEMDDKLEHAMIIFSRQLSNPDFLVRYIQVLEEKKKSFRRERVNIASLITVILVSEGKFEYFTRVLKTLLEEQISDLGDTGRLKSLFRRTETIVEKLLSNWMAISMFSFLKSHVAKSLYLLYQAIKIQCEKGPIDVINGQSYFSLNIDYLLAQNIDFSELTLSVVGSNGRHDYYVKVLNVDSIIQVKQKILDAAYRRRHLVRQRRAHEMDLLWYHPGGEQRILRDQDEFNTRVCDDEPVVINTIQAVGLKDGARVALIEKVKGWNDESRAFQPVSVGAQLFQVYHDTGFDDVMRRDYTRIQTQDLNGRRIKHLMSEEPPSAGMKESRIQLDKEISAPRLLVMKRTVEPFLNDFLSSVFNKVDETPATLKHIFDFFDEMAATYCSGSGQENPDDCAEAWKSNSLPQHYWVTTLTHPSYVFDMRQSRCADQSVSVLANMLDNACKKVIPEMTEDSSLNRVLFVKDLPGYIKTISEYYGGIARRPAPTAVELQREFNTIGQEFTGLFSRFGSLKLLYDFTCRDAADLLDAVAEMM
ncbi:plexin-A4-like [Diadema antillarum]|uniref:plexin-A4-like n=1 Tax=Diadema antillarum TaxID=105358 RepID=UPI003A876246